jgi:protein-disulfide isomerase
MRLGGHMENLLDHQLGSSNPSVTLLEYGDYECPYCGKFDLIIQKLLHDFPKELAYVFCHFPMVNIHPNAGLAAMAAEAAGMQYKYWAMHHQLFLHQENLSGAEVLKLAKKIGLDKKKFQDDLENEGLWKKIERHIEAGIQSQVTGTPSLYLNNIAFEGSSSYESLKKEIELRILNASSKFI